jgi:tetratricopeptide (TPR) repeat protein
VSASDAQPEPLVFGGRLLRTGDRIGGYVFERELGSGGMARVLLARDPGGQPIALKVLRANRFDTGLVRFRREFHALSRLSHPNIIHVEAYGDLHGHPYIAMEYIDGPDLHTVIRSLRSADDAQRYARAEDILIQLCRALAVIHRRGLVHRDLKPSNVLLTREGVCKLTDFGIVKDMDPTADPHVSTTLVGTWAYTSPEHICGQPIDHRSDLYSLGVMLFALVTGKRPFVADSMAGYLEQHRDKRAPRTRDVRAGVPAHLDDICARLLEKRPRERFQSAQEILYRLEADDPAAAIADGPTGWEPPIVGNRAAFEGVEEAVTALTGGHGGVVRVLGDDGAGKSRLLDVAANRARMLGLPYHRLTFRTDEPVFTQAMRLCRELMHELPGSAGGELARIVSAWADGSALRGDTRYALYDAIRVTMNELLDERPRVLLLDDVHEAAPQELDLLRFLDRSLLVSDPRPLLVVETVRPRPNDEDTSLDTVPTRELRLGRLEADDLRALVASLLGPGRATDRIAGRLLRDSDGNAWLAAEYLRSLIAQDLIVRVEGGWQLRVDPDDVAEGRLEIPPEIRTMLRRRIDGIDPDALAVLQVLAVSGQETALDVLADVTRLPEDDLLDHLDHLIAHRLVVEHRRADAESYGLVHRMLGDAVQRELNPERLKELHRQLGEALEARVLNEADVLEVIGEHFRAAGDSPRAYQHLVVAAGRLLERALIEAAATLAQRADAVAEDAAGVLPPSDWTELRIAHLQVKVAALGNRAAWAEAIKLCRDLLPLAESIDDQRTACKARLELARLLRSQGDGVAARQEAEEALKLARRQHYRQGVAASLHQLAAIAWIEGDLDACDALTHEGLLVAQGPQLAPERARLLLTYALALAVRGQVAAAIRHMTEAEALFKELRMQPQRVLALSNASELLVWQADTEDAWARADEAVKLSDDVRYRVGEIVARRARGIAALELGRRTDAQRDLLDARRLARAAELHEEVIAASVALARAALDRGDSASALRHAAIAQDACDRRDNEGYRPLVQAHQAHALAISRPDAAVALLHAAEAALGGLQTARQTQVQLASAEAWLALGDRGTALEVAGEVIRNKAARPFRLMQKRAREFLAANTSGETARRHERLSAELSSDATEPFPVRRRAPEPPAAG